MSMTKARPGIRVLAGLSEIASGYDLIACDVWGVVHDGLRAFDEACLALARFRRAGGTVVLISNAPRPAASVAAMLDGLGVPRAAFDALVTSGDLTRGEIRARRDQPVYLLGPERDRPVFDGLDVGFAGPESAAYVVCTGLFDDETETAEDNRSLLIGMAARRLLMICANPDLVVERGARLIPCAGAIAELYERLGGRVVYTGKPHRAIYEEALARSAALRGGPVARRRILAIGDAIRTDVAGAAAMGWPALLVGRGIHAAEIALPAGGLDHAGLERWAAGQEHRPDAIIERLVW